MSLPAHLNGKSGKCPKCGAVVQVTDGTVPQVGEIDPNLSPQPQNKDSSSENNHFSPPAETSEYISPEIFYSDIEKAQLYSCAKGIAHCRSNGNVMAGALAGILAGAQMPSPFFTAIGGIFYVISIVLLLASAIRLRNAPDRSRAKQFFGMTIIFVVINIVLMGIFLALPFGSSVKSPVTMIPERMSLALFLSLGHLAFLFLAFETHIVGLNRLFIFTIRPMIEPRIIFWGVIAMPLIVLAGEYINALGAIQKDYLLLFSYIVFVIPAVTLIVIYNRMLKKTQPLFLRAIDEGQRFSFERCEFYAMNKTKNIKGPYNYKQIRALASKGSLKPNTALSIDDGSSWVKAKSIKPIWESS
jgi:hypothetical protein